MLRLVCGFKVENERIPTPDRFTASAIVFFLFFFLFDAYVCLILFLLGTFRQGHPPVRAMTHLDTFPWRSPEKDVSANVSANEC